MAFLNAYRCAYRPLRAYPSLLLPLRGLSRSLELFSCRSALATGLPHLLAAAGLDALSLRVDVGVQAFLTWHSWSPYTSIVYETAVAGC